jgi:hypothetical protein
MSPIQAVGGISSEPVCFNALPLRLAAPIHALGSEYIPQWTEPVLR